jgi:hypothetical protein
MTTPREEITRYLQRMPGAREAMHGDPQYHYQVKWLERMFELLNLALEDEGIPEDIRTRVIRNVLYGGVDESEARRRTDLMNRMKEVAMHGRLTQPHMVPVPTDLLRNGGKV